MSGAGNLLPWWRPGDWLLAAAAARLRTTRPAWADAMLAEAEMCRSGFDRFGWAWGCWVASLRASFGAGECVYAAALSAGLAAMATYEWRADEGVVTVLLLGAVTLALGALRPRQAMLSGVLVGLVVSGVIGFEALSGIRPAYESEAQTIVHSLHWLILLLPASVFAAAGARAGRRLRPGFPARSRSAF